MKSIAMMTIAEISAMMRRWEISPTELVEESIRRTERLQPLLNPYITFLADEARQQAAALTAAMPKDGAMPPLYGLPIGIKDLFYTKGILTSGACARFSDFVPDFDSTVAARLRSAGAILMGKTNLQELACGAAGTVSHYGLMRNPHDPAMISGGSSGGSAIAVATGLNYLAMGSDTGGSIRIPASACGVVGFKPSHGLLSLHGVMPLSQSMDHAGPMTRSVLDAAIAMDALTGFDPMDDSEDRYTGAQTRFAEEIKDKNSLKGYKIGVPENYFFEKTDESIEALVREAAARMASLGAELVPVRAPDMDDLPEVSFRVMISEAAWNYRRELDEEPNRITPWIRNRLRKGMNLSAVDYLDAVKRRREIMAGWEELMKQVDAVLCPTLPMTAFPIEGDGKIMLRGRQEDAIGMCTHHTRYANLTGGPALSMPVGYAANGLPAGLMIMGAMGDDRRVLEIGHVYEKHFPFEYKEF